MMGKSLLKKLNTIDSFKLQRIYCLYFWLMLPLVAMECITVVYILVPQTSVFWFFFVLQIDVKAEHHSDKELLRLLNALIIR